MKICRLSSNCKEIVKKLLIVNNTLSAIKKLCDNVKNTPRICPYFTKNQKTAITL